MDPFRRSGTRSDSGPPALEAGDGWVQVPRPRPKFECLVCRCKSKRSRRETIHVSLQVLRPPRRTKEWQGLRVRYSTTCLLEMIMAGPGK